RLLLHHLAVAENRGQDVVEIVRDAARKRSHRFELLRLPQLAFEAVAPPFRPFAVAPVLDGAGRGVGSATFVAQCDATVVIPPPLAGGMPHPVFDLEGLPRTTQIGKRGSRTRAR